MAWMIIPKIAEIVEERRTKIEDDVQKAERINHQAFEILQKYEKKIAEAKENAAFQIEQRKQQLEAETELKKATLKHALDEKIAQSSSVLARERAETIKAVDDVSAQIAELIIAKLDLPQTLKKDENRV